ncbi:MAG: hypothetical protein NTZ05_08415, partial [Chloroflexi bacterium]|nr:hypothetical protein [Chloroflexota bacterium]
QLVDALERALAARLLVDRSEAGKERYLFADEQVHQALYDAIPTPRRRRLHLRAAQELEARAGAAPECEAQELARHFQAANAPEQGARYAFAAGQQAERLFAWPLALRWYRRALQQWEDVGGHAEQRAAALERLGDCCFASTLDASLAVEYYRKALTLYEGLENRRRIAAIHLRIGREYSSGANLELRDARQAFVHLEQARRILEAGPESGALCGVYIALAAAYAMAFEWRPAATWGRAALELGERLGQPGRVAQACVSLGLALALTGQPSEGLAVLARGRELAVAHQDAITADYLRVFTTLVYRLLHQPRSALAAAAQSPDYQTVAAVLLLPPLLAEAHMDLGDAAAALACAGLYQRTLETWGQGRDASASGELGYVQFRAGLWDEARPLLEDGFRRAQSRHDAGAAADAALHLGILLLAQRDLIGAEAGLSQADQFYTATENVLGLLKVLPYQCELLTLRGRAAEAEAALARTRDLMALGENWGGLPGLLALAEGLVHAAQERWSSAEAAFGQALAVCRQYELRWCEARVYDEWGRVLRTQDDGNQASVERGRALQEQAAAFWQTMGAAPWAERTRRGLADA